MWGVPQGTVSPELFEGLLMLQHRGQDSAGMVTTSGRKFFEHKDNGLVNDVFSAKTMSKLEGALPRVAPTMFIPHFEYSCWYKCHRSAHIQHVILAPLCLRLALSLNWLSGSSLAWRRRCSRGIQIICYGMPFTFSLGVVMHTTGNVGIWHVRYRSAGSALAQEAQPPLPS